MINMEKFHDTGWYEEFCRRLDEAKEVMIKMGFGEGLDELIEEMKGVAMDIKKRQEKETVRPEVESWESEGGAVIPPDETSYNVDRQG